MFDPRHTNRRRWLITQDFIAALFNLFGTPERIAAQHTLVRAQWRLLATWLRAGEALMRQLLLIEAAALPKPNTRPLLWKRRTRKRKLMGFSADAPETWRVSFRVLLLDRRRLAGDRRRSGTSVAGEGAGAPSKRLQLDRRDRWHQARWPAPKFHSAWPLAERAEALLRVFNDPAPYARRLARRLYAVAHLARTLLRHPPEAPSLVGEAGFATTHARATDALRVFDTS